MDAALDTTCVAWRRPAPGSATGSLGQFAWKCGVFKRERQQFGARQAGVRKKRQTELMIPGCLAEKVATL